MSYCPILGLEILENYDVELYNVPYMGIFNLYVLKETDLMIEKVMLKSQPYFDH